MGKGLAFGKTILIGDAFVLREVPAIVSSIPFETECVVQGLNEGQGWILEDNRTEVPGYKEKKKDQQIDSINRILEVMKIDIEKNVKRSVQTGGNKDNITISIFSEKTTPIEYVVKVMDLANRLKVQAILAVEPNK